MTAVYHFNNLTPAEAERLAMLMEECAEVQQAVGKILRHGYPNLHLGGGPNNRELLETELGDLQHALDLMIAAEDVDRDVIEIHADEKADRTVKYLHHQDEAPSMRRLSNEGFELIRSFERLRLPPYYDAVGYPTIGYGHLLSKEKWADLSQWLSLSGVTDANDLLKKDVVRFERAVAHLIQAPLSQGQLDALVSFCFNVGEGALRASTLRRVLNQGHYSKIPYQLRRWVYAEGVELKGLARRREAEVIAGQPWIAP